MALDDDVALLERVAVLELLGRDALRILAIGAEVRRLITAKNSRARAKEKDHEPDAPPDEPPPFAFLDDGLGDIWFDDDHVRSGAEWRTAKTTEKQRALLLRMGVKADSIPDQCGEAGDLITVLTVERDVKKREPPTDKQIKYLYANKIDFDRETLTKGAATKLIVEHRHATEKRPTKAKPFGVLPSKGGQLGLLVPGDKDQKT
ncbi:MAG: hypothetical protein HC882_09160 [Acidobacteria bacterium]|nr:hypothetical protein [Acidobacteriota bacterium]